MQPSAASPLITLNFPENLELKVLVDYVSQRLGLNILYDEQAINQRITIKAPAQVSEDSLLGLLDSALKMKQLALVEAEQKGWMRIVPAASLATASVPSTQPSTQPLAGIAVTQMYAIEHADAALVDQVIKPFLTQGGGNSVVLPDSQSLIVTDFASNLRRVEQLIDMIDRPALRERSVLKLLAVQNLEAQSLATQVTQILSAKQQQQTKTVSPVESALVSADVRTNQLVLVGSQSAVDEALELANRLDVPLEVSTKVYQFSSVSPERVDRLAKELIGQAQAQRLYKSAIDVEANLLIVTAPPAMHEKIEQLKADLDVPVSSQASPVRLYKLANATASEVLKTIQAIEGGDGFAHASFEAGLPATRPASGDDSEEDKLAIASAPVPFSRSGQAIAESDQPQDRAFERIEPRQTIRTDKATVTSDPNTNTIIVVADAATQQIYARLIELLDKRRPQVLIEAIIVALDTSNSFSFGVEIGGSDLGGDPELISFSSFGLSRVNRENGQLTIIPGAGFNGAILSSDLVDIVIRALSTSGRARVMSSPRLLVNDNATGTLSAISEAPFSSVNASDTVATTSFGGYAEAGTEITLTPHIGEGDFLQLEYSIALNSFTGEGSSDLPPPRQTNSLDSVVTIPDGHTIIVGGLNLDNRSQTKSAIPILGDIPILEYAFSNRSINRSQATLFVFLRPVILRDDRFEDLKFYSAQDVAAAELPSDYPSSEPLIVR